MDSKVQGLAKEIRSSTTSEIFDLQNYDADQADNLVKAAFKTPIECKEMLGFSFIVGGGKKIRQKYSPSLPKDLSQALKGIGFTEDRGASCDEGCQGTFKFQHDTDKDIKTMHVYPNIKKMTASAIDDEGDIDDLLVVGVNHLSVHGEDHARVAAAADMDDFKQLVVEYCPSFTQRRELLRALKKLQPEVSVIEGKLATMEALQDHEQELYDNVDSLQDKIDGLSSQIEGMISRGQLMKAEITVLLADLQSKEQKITEHIEQTTSKGKKVGKLETQKEKLSEKIASLKFAQGQKAYVPRSKWYAETEEELATLRKRQANNMKEDLKLERRIEFLLIKKAGWYAELVPRPVVQQRQVTKKAPAKKAASSSAGGGWAQVSSKKSARAPSRSSGAKGGGGNLFAMLGDDSD